MDELIGRLTYVSSNVKRQELGDVQALINNVLSDQEMDYYHKEIAISNIFTLIGSRDAIRYFIPVMSIVTNGEPDNSLDPEFMARKLLELLKQNDPTIFVNNDSFIMELFDFVNTSKISYPERILEDILSNYLSDNGLIKNFSHIAQSIEQNNKLLDFRKEDLFMDVIRRKEAIYQNLSKEDLVQDITQTFSVLHGIDSYDIARRRTEIIAETLEFFPDDVSQVPSDLLTEFIATSVTAILDLNDYQMQEELLERTVIKVSKQFYNENYETILAKIVERNPSLPYQSQGLLNDIMEYRERDFESIPSEQAYREEMRAIKQISSIDYGTPVNKADFMANRIYSIPNDAIFRHLDELLEIISPKSPETEYIILYFVQKLMEKGKDTLKDLPEEERNSVYEKLIHTLSSSKLEDYRKGYGYEAILSSVAPESDYFIDVLNLLSSHLTSTHSFMLSNIIGERLQSVKGDPKREYKELIGCIDFISNLDLISSYDKEIDIQGFIEKTSPEVISTYFLGLANKLIKLSENNDFEFPLPFKIIMNKIAKSEKYKDSPEEQINIVKLILNEYSSSVSRKDSQYYMDYTSLVENLLAGLPAQVKADHIDELQYFIARSGDIQDYGKISIISEIYYSSLDDMENIPEDARPKRILDLVEYLLASNILDASTKQIVFENIIDKTDPKIVDSIFDRLVETMKNIPVTGSTEMGSVTGLLFRKRFQNKYANEKPRNPLPELIDAIDKILENKDLRNFEKTQAIISTLKNLPFDISKEYFTNISKYILNSNAMDEFDKASCVGKLFGAIIDDPNKFNEVLSMISSVDEYMLSNFYKNYASRTIWKEASESEEKYQHLKEYYESILKSTSSKYNNPTTSLIEMLSNMSLFGAEKFYNTLIEQIDSIEVEGLDKQKVYAELLIKLKNYPQNEDIFNAYKDSMQKAGSNPTYDFSSRDALISSIALEKIQSDFSDKWQNMNITERRNILSGIQYALDKGDPELLTDPSLVHFIEAATKGIISVDRNNKENIVESYKNLLAKVKPERIDSYKALIESGKSVPEDKMDDFEAQLKLLKIKEGRIPKVFYDYVIREAIRGNIDKLKRKSLVMNSITSMAQDHLEEIGVDGYLVTFAKLEPFTIGSHTSNFIRISEDYFETLSISDIVDTAFHESRHAYQKRAIKNMVIDKKFYKMLKENIISKYDFSFYNRNYENMENEFDARVYAALKTNEYLLSIGLTAKEIAEGASKSLEEELLRDKAEDRSIKKSLRDENKSIDEMVLEAINSDPAKIDTLFGNNPLLAIEYEVTSTNTDAGVIYSARRKTKAEIEEARRELLEDATSDEEKEKIEELFDYILNGEKGIDHSATTDGEYLRLNGYASEAKIATLKTTPESTPESNDVTASRILDYSKSCFLSHSAEERYSIEQELLLIKDKPKEVEEDIDK